jgi:hypothetical protein
MNNEMSDDEQREIGKKRDAALKQYFGEAVRELGMSQEEIENSRIYRRMMSLQAEGFTLEQAEEIFLKEEGED